MDTAYENKVINFHEMCRKYLIDFICDNSKSIEWRSEVVKSLLKLTPEVKSLLVTVSSNNFSEVFHFKYDRGEYPQLRKWRADVLKRDGFKCIKCGSAKNLHAHHVNSWKDYPDERFDLSNGQTLCRKCHCKTDNYGRKNNAIC